MKIILVAHTALALFFTCLTAAAQDAWALTIQQGNRQFQTTDPVRLQRASFSLLFTANKRMGFAVLAATECKSIESLKTTEQISEAIRPANIAAEGTVSENTFLVVNASSSLVAGESPAHAWVEDKDNDVHSFQDLKKAPADQMISTRNIKEIMLQSTGGNSKLVPVSKYPEATICLLATGLPPVGYMAHTEPKLVRISFE